MALDFEEFIDIVNADKNNFSEKAEVWINDVNKKLEDLEAKTKDCKRGS